MYSLRKEKVSVTDRLFLIGAHGPCRDSELQPFELDLLKQTVFLQLLFSLVPTQHLSNKYNLLSFKGFAILIPLLESTEKLCSSWIAMNDFHNHYYTLLSTKVSHICRFSFRVEDTILIDASRIIDRCIYIDAQNVLNLVFVSIFPNSMEYE